MSETKPDLPEHYRHHPAVPMSELARDVLLVALVRSQAALSLFPDLVAALERAEHEMGIRKSGNNPERERERLKAEIARLRGLRFVCDGPPGPEAGRFIELEDADGNSVSIGEWSERADGYWEMRLSAALGKGEP